MFVFHGTNKQNAENIKLSGFRLHLVDVDATGYLVSDLGAGIYSYARDSFDNGSCLWNPFDNAREFAITYRCDTPKDARVLKVEITDNEALKVLDMDDPSNVIRFTKLRKTLEHRARQLYNRLPKNNATFRHNIDGIIFELAYKRGAFPDVDVVTKSTFTAFEKGEISNFGNGLELVVRHPNVIGNIAYARKGE